MELSGRRANWTTGSFGILSAILAFVYFLSSVFPAKFSEALPLDITVEQLRLTLIVGIVIIVVIGVLIYASQKDENPAERFKEAGKEIGKSYASETERIKKLNQHKEDTLRVYQGLAASFLSRPIGGFGPRFTWGNVSLEEVGVHNSPNSDPNYDDAILDLQCWPEVYDKFERVKSGLQGINAEIRRTREEALQAIRKVMGHYGLENGSGGRSLSKWSNDESILSLLILRQISEGKSYTKPIIGLQSGQWVCVLDQSSRQSEGGLVFGVNPEEARPLVELFGDLEAKINEVMEEPNYFANLCSEISKVQRDSEEFGKSYQLFTSSLASGPIKHLRHLDFPNGGKCDTCLGLRA